MAPLRANKVPAPKLVLSVYEKCARLRFHRDLAETTKSVSDLKKEIRMATSVSNSRKSMILKGRLLVVEEKPMQSQSFKEALAEVGLVCDYVENVEQAAQAMNQTAYHAAIVDLFLGSIDPIGIKVIDEIEKHRLPIVVISDHPDLQLYKNAVNHGASYLLEKPFEISELLSALKKLWEEPRGLEGIIDRYLDNHDLTPKEREVARLLLKGLANKELADIEGITDRTIKCHVSAIFQKCRVASRSELFSSIFSS